MLYSAQAINLKTPHVQAEAGGTVVVPVIALTELVDVHRLEFRFQYNPAVLLTPLATPGDAGGTLSSTIIGDIISITIDYSPPLSGTDLHLADVRFDVSPSAAPGDASPFPFEDMTGGPRAQEGEFTVIDLAGVETWRLMR